MVVLGRRKLWGIYFGHFAWGTTSTFFLTRFPTYLVTYRHLDFIKAGFYASLPFVGAFAGVLCPGALSQCYAQGAERFGWALGRPLAPGANARRRWVADRLGRGYRDLSGGHVPGTGPGGDPA